MNTAAAANPRCMICMGPMIAAGIGGSPVPGRYTTECGHSFHTNCLINNIKQGITSCPLCLRVWKNLSPILSLQQSNAPQQQIYPIQYPIPRPRPPLRYYTPQQQIYRPYNNFPQEPQLFNDDDPLQLNPTNSPQQQQQQITIKSHPEYPSLAASQSSISFPVLIRIIAPPATSFRSPIDLVLVLDISGSMSGPKLTLLKQAVSFVINNLGPCDRLSIVIFHNTAHRVYPLRIMSDGPGGGKESAVAVVNSLMADGGTEILAGLQKGIRVLSERRSRNPVASVLLLSDGQDNQGNARIPDITAAAVSAGVPVHTFGFGLGHDTTLLHGVANATEATFSFIESMDVIGEAFARCVGGLLSVVAKDLTIRIWTVSTGVKIVKIPYGGSLIRSGGTQGVIKVGMLYADEEKRFLVYLSVPTLDTDDDIRNIQQMITKLLDPSCEYKDPSSAMDVITVVEGDTVTIQRPKSLPSSSPDPLVVREKNRLEMLEDIDRAMLTADSGDLVVARSLLEQRVAKLTIAAASGGVGGQQNSDFYASLQGEMAEIKRRMDNLQMYKQMGGRAYMMSMLSAHGLQRATTRGNDVPSGYDTPGILALVNKCKVEKIEDDANCPPVMGGIFKKCKVENDVGHLDTLRKIKREKS